ncbi:MAG: ubiquinone biosynthesis protein [Gloeomargaritaceae cyanobacterium C42_A2020_066]|nr:ubiquinone biosynthesis protein [Gloeomargaritaceae cyanobacterium C42_A2020_066]
MHLLTSATSNTSVNVHMQKQTRNPIVKGFMLILSKVLIVKASISMLFGDNSLQTVGDMTEGLLATPAYKLLAEHLKQDSMCRTIIQERYIPPTHDLDKLLSLPSDSLGYIYAAQMKKSGYNPNLHEGMTVDSDAHYVEIRLSQTHDIWHIVTGFDTTIASEFGLQAFYLAQFPYPLATMLIANALIFTTLKTPEMLPQLLEAIAQGFKLGKTAKPLFAQKWEEEWSKPLSQWQADLNIQPIPSQ